MVSFPLICQGTVSYWANWQLPPAHSILVIGSLSAPPGCLARPGRWFPFACWIGLGICRMDHTKKEGLCISKAQVRSKPMAQTSTKKPPAATPKEKIVLSLSFFRSQLHTNLEREPGTRDSLVTFSARSVSLQSPCPGGPGNLLNDHGFGYLLPQGHLMYLALVGSCRHLQNGRKSCPSNFRPKGFLLVRCFPVHWHPQNFSTNSCSAVGCKTSGQPTAKFTRTGHFSIRFLAIF